MAYDTMKDVRYLRQKSMAQKEHDTPCTMIKLKVIGIGCNESGEMNLKAFALGSQEIDSR